MSVDSTSQLLNKSGNVVVGYTSDNILMLDIDGKREDEVIKFAKEYTEFHNLGSVAVFKTSEDGQVDLYAKPVKHYCIIFGTLLDWSEIQWHILETKRLGMIKRDFAKLREFGFITIRVNAKNNKIPPPKTVYYFPNSDDRGITEFLRFWRMCKNLGSKRW